MADPSVEAHRDLGYALRFLQHAFEQLKELVPLNVFRYNEQCIDVSSWTVNAQTIRAESEDLAAAAEQQMSVP